MKAKSEVWDQKVRSDLCLIYGISRLYWAPHLGPNRSTIRTWAIEIDKTISTLKNTKNWYTIVALSAIIAIFTILDNFTKLLQYFYNTIAILLQYYSNIYNTFTIPLQYFYNTFTTLLNPPSPPPCLGVFPDFTVYFWEVSHVKNSKKNGCWIWVDTSGDTL